MRLVWGYMLDHPLFGTGYRGLILLQEYADSADAFYPPMLATGTVLLGAYTTHEMSKGVDGRRLVREQSDSMLLRAPSLLKILRYNREVFKSNGVPFDQVSTTEVEDILKLLAHPPQARIRTRPPAATA